MNLDNQNGVSGPVGRQIERSIEGLVDAVESDNSGR